MITRSEAHQSKPKQYEVKLPIVLSAFWGGKIFARLSSKESSIARNRVIIHSLDLHINIKCDNWHKIHHK